MNITFFDYPFWSKGKIINELISKLPIGWNGELLNWSEGHELSVFTSRSDNIFCTSVGGLVVLINSYNIPLQKINVICHDEDDFAEFKKAAGDNLDYYLSNVRGLAVPSYGLIPTILSHGVSRIPQKINYGMDVTGWEFNPRKTINTIGICGHLRRHSDNFFKDSKRSYLINKLAEEVNLSVLYTDGKIHSYADVKEWYKNVDLVVISGVFEGGPLSPFEAALSGIPVIGNSCGSWVDMAHKGGGIILPTNDRDFLLQGKNAIQFLKNDTIELEKMLHIANEYVLKKHNWDFVLNQWLQFFINPSSDLFKHTKF